MDVNELLKLKRPLTDEEAAFLEQEVLNVARELQGHIDTIAARMDPEDPDATRLKAAAPNIVRNIEKALSVDAEIIASDDAAMARQNAAAIYSWEKLPVYEWNSRFGRVVGRLLSQLPKRWYIHAHLLAAQATVISHAICMFYRELPPGEVVPPAELEAWRTIACQAARTALERLDELSSLTALGRSEVAHGRDLMRKVRHHFELADGHRGPHSSLLH